MKNVLSMNKIKGKDVLDNSKRVLVYLLFSKITLAKRA